MAESGANINFKSVPSGLTGLHYAIKNNNIQLINDLLSLKENNGLSLDMANSENTALIEYAKSVNPEACAYITDILSGKNQITEKRKNKSMKINRNNMKNLNNIYNQNNKDLTEQIKNFNNNQINKINEVIYENEYNSKINAIKSVVGNKLNQNISLEKNRLEIPVLFYKKNVDGIDRVCDYMSK